FCAIFILEGGNILLSNQIESGLIGYWKLKGDCKDYSEKGNHGINHGVNLNTGEFNGRDSYVEVTNSPSLNFGTGDFSISAWVNTENDVDDVIGDVMSKYDPQNRKGWTLSINSSACGYNSHGNDKHVYFGIDNAKLSDWTDCGRPNEFSNYVNGLTVFDGKLYVGTSETKDEEGWCHVYRYEGGQKWTDCGRVGNQRTTGIGPVIVHNGNLYASTWTYDWTRTSTENYDFCHVYRYKGGKEWEDCGQPGSDKRIMCIASYKGKLYVAGRESYKVYAYEGGKEWKLLIEFPKDGPKRCAPHTMGIHDGKLYVGYPAVYSFDGDKWEFLGIPVESTQTHSLEVYKGNFYAGTWPEGRAGMYKGGEDWEDCGRLGKSTEINALTVYNGKFYAGSIPYAEVYRYEGGKEWTLMRRFLTSDVYSVSNFEQDAKAWARLTALTIYQGKMFAGVGSCTASIQDAPCDVRGKVFYIEAGKNVTYDNDLGAGWKHITAVKENNELKLYINGKLAVTSSNFEQKEYDVSTDRPLQIGSGEIDYFSGKISEVHIYNRALSNNEIGELSENHD
ncbi:MAG: LamG domain-containing protein, partial [Candidatus Poribacteria bacterium]